MFDKGENYSYLKKITGYILKNIFKSLFKEIYINLEELIENWHNVTVEEFIDGTMINLFYHDKWTISTRSCLYADCNWYSNKKFNTMFEEAEKNYKIDYNLLNKNYCYTFVLQHPENRIVTEYIEPKIILVQITDLNTLENINLNDFCLKCTD